MARRDDDLEAAGDLEAAIAALHQGSRAAFLPARKALASRLQRAGRTSDAARVRALPKPTLSAWAVSHLFAREPRAMERLLGEGEDARDALRGTLARGGDPGALRAAIERVRHAGAALAERASELAEEDTGKAPSAAIVERIRVDLSALALSPSAADAARRGWIASDLDPPGLEMLTELPPIERAPTRASAEARPGERPGRAAKPRAVPAKPRSATAGQGDARRVAEAKCVAEARRVAEAKRVAEAMRDAAQAREEARAAKVAERERARRAREEARASERARRARLEEEARRAEERAADLREAAARAAALAEDARRHAERARTAARARR